MYNQIYILDLSVYHHELMKLLQIMWLTTRRSQQHRFWTKLVLMRHQLQIMPASYNNFFEYITDQLSNNPKMIAGGASITGKEIHHTLLLQPSLDRSTKPWTWAGSG